MIRFTVIGQKEVVATLGRVSGEVRRRVRTAIGRLTLRLERRIKEQKLSGQVLRVRTGTLRRSVSSVVVSNPAVVVGTVSTNVEYARVHEFGFDGTVTVREHMRTVKQAFGRPLKTPKTVRVTATKSDGSAVEFDAVVRIDTPGEADYYRNGGILQYVLRNMLRS